MYLFVSYCCFYGYFFGCLLHSLHPSLIIAPHLLQVSWFSLQCFLMCPHLWHLWHHSNVTFSRSCCVSRISNCYILVSLITVKFEMDHWINPAINLCWLSLSHNYNIVLTLNQNSFSVRLCHRSLVYIFLTHVLNIQ